MSEFQAAELSVALAGSEVFDTIETRMLLPVCDLVLFIALKAAPRVAYDPLAPVDPVTVTFCAGSRPFSSTRMIKLAISLFIISEQV